MLLYKKDRLWNWLELERSDDAVRNSFQMIEVQANISRIQLNPN